MVTQQIIMLDIVNVMVSLKQLYPCNDSNLCRNLVAQVLNFDTFFVQATTEIYDIHFLYNQLHYIEIIVLGCRPFLVVTTKLAVIIVSLSENLSFLHLNTF